MTTPEPFVYRLENVTKRLAKAESVFTLRIPELTVSRGEFVAFVGQSGCGKSTLLDLLGLVSTPTTADRFDVAFDPGDAPGSISTADEPSLAGLRRRHLGYVLQDGGLLPFLTVGDNIVFARRVNGLEVRGSGEGPALARALGIEAQWHKKPAFLSGGQRQRVAIARALAHRPVVVLADEPTGAVDKLTANAICDLLLATARERRTTVMMVTHDESLLVGRAARVFTFELEQTPADGIVSTLVATDWEKRLGAQGRGPAA